MPAEKSLRLHAIFSQTILYMPQGREVPVEKNSELEKTDLFFLKEVLGKHLKVPLTIDRSKAG